jgi:hypothetical protein
MMVCGWNAKSGSYLSGAPFASFRDAVQAPTRPPLLGMFEKGYRPSTDSTILFTTAISAAVFIAFRALASQNCALQPFPSDR